MKFRIVEQRGVFRTQEEFTKTSGIYRDYKWWEFQSDGYSRKYLGDKVVTVWRFIYTSEFDTYKKAENHIKKHFGINGVEAIEAPEWRTV